MLITYQFKKYPSDIDIGQLIQRIVLIIESTFIIQKY